MLSAETVRKATVIAASLCLAACGPSKDEKKSESMEMDIFLVSMSGAPGRPAFGTPRNVTNRPDYDNQPYFFDDGSGFLYTVMSDHQADTWRYDIARDTVTRVTASTASEYSPTVMPDGDGFSVVRLEVDGFARLWRFPMDGRSPRVLLRDVTGVSQYSWVDAQTVALFISAPEPYRLALVDVATEEQEVVATDIGRCIRPVPGQRALAYVDKSDETQPLLRYMDLDSHEITRSLPAIQGKEDFAFMADGAILMGDGARLFINRPGTESWEMVADWSDVLTGEITRIAVSPRGDHLAVVVKDT
jgi:Tol biopolymer transport system component